MDSVVIVGIFAGCFVFVGTMVVVGLLLYFGGSLDRMAKEEAGLTTNLYETKARLHDHVLSRAKALSPMPPQLHLTFDRDSNSNSNDPPRVPPTKYALRPVTREDLDELFSISHGFLAAENLIWHYLDVGPFESKSEMEDVFFKSGTGTSTKGEQVLHVLEERHSQDSESRLVGMLTTADHSPQDLRLSVREFWLEPQSQQTGLAQLVMYHVLCHVFESTPVYRRLEWPCDGQNLRGRKFAHSFGFQLESLMSKHRIVKDANVDTAMFVIVNSDWPVVKAHVQGLVARRLARGRST